MFSSLMGSETIWVRRLWCMFSIKVRSIALMQGFLSSQSMFLKLKSLSKTVFSMFIQLMVWFMRVSIIPYIWPVTFSIEPLCFRVGVDLDPQDFSINFSSGVKGCVQFRLDHNQESTMVRVPVCVWSIVVDVAVFSKGEVALQGEFWVVNGCLQPGFGDGYYVWVVFFNHGL